MKLLFKSSVPVVKNIYTFVFTPVEPLVWQAGQYIHYTLPHTTPDDRGDERWFTISSAPYEKDVWITTRLLPEQASSFKKTLAELDPGQQIETDAPEGNFTNSDPSKQYIYIAGGIGITPFRSILKQLDHEGSPINVRLLYASRTDNEIVFKDELEALSAAHDNFTIEYFTGDTQISTADLQHIHQEQPDADYYISGPEPMVDAYKDKLVNLDVSPDHIKLDHFPGYKEI